MACLPHSSLGRVVAQEGCRHQAEVFSASTEPRTFLEDRPGTEEIGALPSGPRHLRETRDRRASRATGDGWAVLVRGRGWGPPFGHCHQVGGLGGLPKLLKITCSASSGNHLSDTQCLPPSQL